MIKIDCHAISRKSAAFYPQQYSLDTSTTMGRLIKHMLDRGHYGQEVLDSVVYIDRRQFDSHELDKQIHMQIEQLLREGREPVKALVGGMNYHEFERYAHQAPGFWTCKTAMPVRDPRDPSGYRLDIRLWGLPITIIPGMEGVIVLDRQMLEVHASPSSRW